MNTDRKLMIVQHANSILRAHVNNNRDLAERVNVLTEKLYDRAIQLQASLKENERLKKIDAALKDFNFKLYEKARRESEREAIEDIIASRPYGKHIA